MSTFVLIASGWAFQFSFFINTNPVVVAMLFITFGIGVSAMAMFLASLISTSGTAQTGTVSFLLFLSFSVGYAFVLVGFVFQTILSGGEGMLVDLLWTDNIYAWVVRLFLFLALSRFTFISTGRDSLGPDVLPSLQYGKSLWRHCFKGTY